MRKIKEYTDECGVIHFVCAVSSNERNSIKNSR